MFRLLVNIVSGIGPKTALNILSGMNPVAFRGAVAEGEKKRLDEAKDRAAAMRKLAHPIYGVIKCGTPFDPASVMPRIDFQDGI